MRTALILAALGTVAVSLAACGDASTSAGTTRRGNTTQLGGGVDDGEGSDDQDTPDQGNPNANTPPPPPSGTGTSTGQLEIALSSATPAANLGDKVELTATLTPKAGFQGVAELSVTGLPAGVTATFDPPAPSLAAGAAALPVKVTLNVAMSAIPSAAGTASALTVTAKQAAISATAPANFKVNPAAKLTIPVNIDALRTTGTKFLDQWGAQYGAAPVALKTQTGNPIVFTVFNADSKAHIVHGNNGFTHGSTTAGQEVQPNAFEMLNGAPRTRSLPPGANVNGYPHEGANGQSAGFQIQVTAAP